MTRKRPTVRRDRAYERPRRVPPGPIVPLDVRVHIQDDWRLTPSGSPIRNDELWFRGPMGRRGRRRLLRDRRGSATTEGVIVALFMAIVFGASIWVTRLFVGSLAVGREVRAQVDGPSFTGGTGGAPDSTRIAHFGRVRPLASEWVPSRAAEIDTIRVQSVEGIRAVTVEQAGPIGQDTEELRWRDSRRRNEVPRAGAEGNYRAMREAWCNTGMCSL